MTETVSDALNSEAQEGDGSMEVSKHSCLSSGVARVFVMYAVFANCSKNLNCFELTLIKLLKEHILVESMTMKSGFS